MDRRNFLELSTSILTGLDFGYHAGTLYVAGRPTRQQQQRMSHVVVLVQPAPPNIPCLHCDRLLEVLPQIQANKLCREAWFGVGGWQGEESSVTEVSQYARAAVPYNYKFSPPTENSVFPTIHFFVGTGNSLMLRFTMLGFAEGDAERIIEIVRWCTARQ